MNSSDLFIALNELASQASLSPDLEALVYIELTGDDPAQWQVRISGGVLALESGQPAEPDLTVSAASDTAIKIYEKKMKPMAAFMTGKIKIKGDLGKMALLKDLVFGRKK